MRSSKICASALCMTVSYKNHAPLSGKREQRSANRLLAHRSHERRVRGMIALRGKHAALFSGCLRSLWDNMRMNVAVLSWTTNSYRKMWTQPSDKMSGGDGCSCSWHDVVQGRTIRTEVVDSVINRSRQLADSCIGLRQRLWWRPKLQPGFLSCGAIVGKCQKMQAQAWSAK